MPTGYHNISSRSIFAKYEQTHNLSKATRSKTMGTTTLFTFFILASCLLGLIECLPAPMIGPEVEASGMKVLGEATKPEIKVIGEGTKPNIKVMDVGKKPVMPQPPKPSEKELLSLEAEEKDVLLPKVPFKNDLRDASDPMKEGLTKGKLPKTDATPPVDYFEVYRPPLIEPPKHGRYPIEYKDDMMKATDFNPTKAQGQFVFNYLIKNQIENQIKEVDQKDKLVLQSLLSKTSELHGFGERDNELTLFQSMMSKSKSYFKSFSPNPTSLSLMKDTIQEFQRVDYKISLREDLWMLITFHAFHSSEAEDHLIGLYQTKEFRKVMIEFISKLTKFDTKENGLAWPIHEEILKIENKAIYQLRNTPSYHNFMRFHSYLLKRSHNELMELLDRDVLISQLKNHNIHTDARRILEDFHPNWQESESNEEEAAKLAMNLKEKVDKLDPKENEVELQGAMNILLHLRAFGSDELKTMIENAFKPTIKT
ncbi:uncharacterized protein MELLADRAFT_110566 [Melampsora larici-populina 98AG31]|uniref:Uncharacterized protein n=1 Tax=Melampsora larici-populina (strain 98AG31 / pathotype 3-4-7) TaxID=747676 RepID=F4S083_MELLP|nr:uncharacterized protein MELLADRAFT_110566 [Melampsora larici-populina 98AG31]EGG01980.1 hypothetical protein MELLADRAFT_110566 [Melampsora larici-populina 98AG31]